MTQRKPGDGGKRKGGRGGPKRNRGPQGANAEADLTVSRAVAWQAQQRIDVDGAYANLVVPQLLERSSLSERDRGFVTNLVYGTTRMRRACDHLIEPFLMRDIDPEVRSLLRLGAYQLHFLGTPSHAAVGETVDVAPRKVSGFVNAILRRVAEHTPTWPNELTELSYPDWMGAQLIADWGEADAIAALRHMNQPATVTERADGYRQDMASQWVVEAVAAEPGHRVADLCSAPGGKATALAATGASVFASDHTATRLGLVRDNQATLRDGLDGEDSSSAPLGLVVADATAPPWQAATFDRVLVDAPCSGLGVLRRRADARWRVDHKAPERLASLQRSMLASAADLVAPGGRLIYSVCTLTAVETTGVAQSAPPGFESVPIADVAPEGRWRPHGTGGALLPQDHDTDGMAVYVWRRTASDR